MNPRQSSNNNNWRFVTAILIVLGLMGTLIGLNAAAISDLRRQMPIEYVQKERYKTDMQVLRDELSKIQVKLDTLLMRQSTAKSHDSDRPN